MSVAPVRLCADCPRLPLHCRLHFRQHTGQCTPRPAPRAVVLKPPLTTSIPFLYSRMVISMWLHNHVSTVLKTQPPVLNMFSSSLREVSLILFLSVYPWVHPSTLMVAIANKWIKQSLGHLWLLFETTSLAWWYYHQFVSLQTSQY